MRNTPLFKRTPRDGLGASLVLQRHGVTLLGSNRVALLTAIEKSGSITRAAQTVGISYKAAWDSVDSMNNISERPLVEKMTGGRSGGGARLTPHGAKLLRLFNAIEEENEKKLLSLKSRKSKAHDVNNAIARFALTTTARNQFSGKIKRIVEGAINSEVSVDIGCKTVVVAVIPNSAIADLGLVPSLSVGVVFPASSVMVSTDPNLKISARNQIAGFVSRVEKGAVNSEISMVFGDGKTVCANVTNSSVDRLSIRVGTPISALVKASSVILYVT